MADGTRKIKGFCLNEECETKYFRVAETRSLARILHFDIETAPMKVYVWDNHPDFIPDAMLDRDWYVICWSANWDDSDRLISAVQTPEEAINANDERIVRILWDLMDAADIVVTKNGKSFDEKKMNERFVCYGLPPISQYRHVDTQEVLKKNFRFSWNGLDAVRHRMGGEGKIKTDFSWWVKCMQGNQEYLNKMSEYCGKDIFENKQLYHDIRAWDKQHPNMGIYSQTGNPCCPVCGSENLEEIEVTYKTQVNEYMQFRCLECGRTPRARKPLKTTNVQLVG